MKAHPRVILAFDFGLKYIGLAIGQEITNTSHTFFSLKANSGLPNWDELDVIVKDWKPELFVVGNPLNMDGSNSKIKNKSDNFSKLINKRYNIPVELMDERLSTREATDRMRSDSIFLTASAADIDGLSAQVILESWFGEQS